MGSAIILYIDPELADHLSWTSGILTGVGVALVAFFLMYLAYLGGDQMILYTNGAEPLQNADDPQLFNVVEEIAIAAGIPMPSVYLIRRPGPECLRHGPRSGACVRRDYDRPA